MARIEELRSNEHEIVRRCEEAEVEYDNFTEKLEQAKEVWSRKLEEKKKAKAELEIELAKVSIL